MKSSINSQYIKHGGIRICQGDILRDFEYGVWTIREDGKLKVANITIPYLVILTQECDLEQDFKTHNGEKVNQDKFLHSILVCPAYVAEQFKEGTHLSEFEFIMQSYGRDLWDRIRSNQNSRYYFLGSNSNLQIPELVVDFKHYYTISREVIYDKAKNHYLGSLNELFRESLSQRFAYYLSRIGLPTITDTVKAEAFTE